MIARGSTQIPQGLRWHRFALGFILTCALKLSAQQYIDTAANPDARRTNDPAQGEIFRDRGLGLFVHWSVDGPLGGVISHSLVGASPDYVERFFRTLPGYFNPDQYQPEKWAALAKLAGFEYVMLTAKHHSGFCMWDTATTVSGSCTRLMERTSRAS